MVQYVKLNDFRYLKDLNILGTATHFDRHMRKWLQEGILAVNDNSTSVPLLYLTLRNIPIYREVRNE